MKFSEEIKKYLKNKKQIKELLNNYSSLPKANGIYIVTNEEDEDVEFLDTTTAITEYNGRSLLYDKVKLIEKYNKGNKKVLYIGKAACDNGRLQKRMSELLDYAQGNCNNHRGGRALWQIKDWDKLMIYHCEVDCAEDKEKELIRLHKAEYSVFPVANWRE